MTDYDAIVIGSGAGGMTAALALARAGERVLVLEQHYAPGGWCHSFTLNGHRFSPGVHYIGELQPGGMMRRIYEGLGVANDMTFLELNPDGFDHVRIGDDTFDIPKGKLQYIERLSSRFPSEADGIRGYLNLVEKISGELNSAMSLSTLGDMLKLPFKLPATLRYGFSSLSKVLDHFIDDPLLRAILTIQCGDHGLPPSKVPTAMHAAIAGHYFNGGYYPRGGAFTIPRAFLRGLKRAGGKLQLRAEVDRILIEGRGSDRRAIGVRLADGTEIRAKRVISNADPHVTFDRLVGAEHLSGRLRRRLRKTRYSISALSLFMAVDMDARGAGLDSGNYWYSKTPDIGAGYRVDDDIRRLQSDELHALFLTVTTLKDPSKRRDRLHTMEAFTFVGYDAFKAWATSRYGDRPDSYLKVKEDLTARMLHAAENILPGISDNIVSAELGTPLTNAHYCAATRGNLYGTEKSRWQIGPFAYQPRTGIRGLSMCGASTTGHGVAGATISGLVAVSQMLHVPIRELMNADGQALAIYPCDDPSVWPDALKPRPQAPQMPVQAVANG